MRRSFWKPRTVSHTSSVSLAFSYWDLSILRMPLTRCCEYNMWRRRSVAGHFCSTSALHLFSSLAGWSSSLTRDDKHRGLKWSGKSATILIGFSNVTPYLTSSSRNSNMAFDIRYLYWGQSNNTRSVDRRSACLLFGRCSFSIEAKGLSWDFFLASLFCSCKAYKEENNPNTAGFAMRFSLACISSSPDDSLRLFNTLANCIGVAFSIAPSRLNKCSKLPYSRGTL